MACFLVPMGEAIVTTVIQKAVESHEKKSGVKHTAETGITWGRKLSWLNKLLWGGTILLAFEHLWHGEIVPWPPFLTAMKNPADVALMLHEVATIGTAMAILVTVVWWIMVMIADAKIRNSQEIKTKAVKGEA
jgi:hypothetical protein